MNDDAQSLVMNLLGDPGLAALGPERRATAMPEARLRSKVLAALKKTDFPQTRQDLVLALLLLWHDHLDASHTIAQAINSADGSVVHAIMHRREPDYWNSKYWWRQAGWHPAFDELGSRAGEWLQTAGKPRSLTAVLSGNSWDPHGFVDACERVADRSAADPEVMALRELQRIEFEVLLQHFLLS